jgi:dCMP deaminase
MMTWDEFFIQQAILVSTKSKDPSTKVGCIIVDPDNVLLSMGFNGFPRGVIETTTEYVAKYGEPKLDPYNDKYINKFDRWERPQKYSLVSHAEQNAVFNAARKGVSLKGARAYLNWEPVPCAECAKALIQAGITEVIGPDVKFTGAGSGVNYQLSFTDMMFKEAGVKTTRIFWNWKQPGDRPVAAINSEWVPCE